MRTPSYHYPVTVLSAGSSFGNFRAFARLSRETDLKGLWSSLDNQYYVGDWTVELLVNGAAPAAETTSFFAESQATAYRAGDVIVEKRFFLPFLRDERSLAAPSPLQSAVSLVGIRNGSPDPVECRVRHVLRFPAEQCDIFTKQPPADQTEKRVDIRRHECHAEVITRGRPLEARIVGSTGAWSDWSVDDSSLALEYRCSVGPGAFVEIPFVVAFSPEGAEAALQVFRRCGEPRKLLDESKAAYENILSRTELWTPEPVINRGLQWAKINTVRVQHQYRIGQGFTNDPPQDIIVVRDLAWYVLGSDYVTPEFSLGLLLLAEQYGFHEEGKLTEYLHADEDPPERHDYKLNINDDTPLFVYAAHHHALAAAKGYSLRRAYPLMRRACEYLLTQVKDGLVWCTADGTNVWGISGWRNIIDGYNLAGAVTEINAECYYALVLTAQAAQHVGAADEAQRFSNAAGELRAAINAQLVSRETGLYLLNIDNQGIRHDDVTGDLVFPVMFGVADEEMSNRILETLTSDDHWTPFGSRTVSSSAPNYHPDFGYQLVGGLWHNLMAWTAYCLRFTHPQMLVEGMINIYRSCEPERPVDFGNVVPGEFPERLHGETYVSRGMAMSPWMPPTYLWLGVEGLLGVYPAGEECAMNPSMHHAWEWIAVKDLLWRGERITAFLHEGVLYATHRLHSRLMTHSGVLLRSSVSSDDIFAIALRVGGEVLLFVASDCDCAGTATVHDGTAVIAQDVSLPKGKAMLYRFPGEHTQRSL